MYEKEKAEIAIKEALTLSTELGDFLKFSFSKINDPQWLQKFATVDQQSQARLLSASTNLIVSWAEGIRYLLLFLSNDQNPQNKNIIQVVDDYLAKIILDSKEDHPFEFIE